MGYIRIQCSVTDDNKIALNRKKNTIVRVLNGKIQEFEIEYKEFEMTIVEDVRYNTDEEIKTKILEMLKYTPYLEIDKLIIRRYETNE